MTNEKLKGSKKARLSMARLAAVQCVYQWMQTGSSARDILDYYNSYFKGLKSEEGELLPPDKELLSKILQGVQMNFSTIEDVISQHLTRRSEGKEAKKDMLVLSVLYCGAYELMNILELDTALIISEYLHVTKSFYDGAEVKLVNAVLDALKTTLSR
jgi:N utilization substance protein B